MHVRITLLKIFQFIFFFTDFPFYFLLFVATECNIVNPIQNLQGIDLLYVSFPFCFSFCFGLLFSILIQFKTANFGKL